MMLRGPSNFQGRCLQPAAACRSAAVCHRPAARCNAVSRRQVVVQARGPPRGGSDRDKEKEKEKEREKQQKNEKKKGKEKDEEEDIRSRRGAWEGGEANIRPSGPGNRGAKDESQQDQDDDSSDAPKQPKGLRFIGSQSNSSVNAKSNSSLGSRFFQPNATVTASTTTTNTTTMTGIAPVTATTTVTTASSTTVKDSATFLPSLAQIKAYWSDPDTVFKAANLPAAALLCAKDVGGTSTVLDFLNHFPILGVAAPNSSGKPQEVSLECVMSCNSDEILLSAQPSTGNKAPDQRKRRTLCDLPWTTNYFIGDVNKPPGQLSDKERTAIYKDQSAEFQKGYKAEKLGTEKIRSSTKGGDWRDEQEQLAALEFKYMDMLTAAQQTPRRRIEVEEVKVLGKKRHVVWLVLPEPDKLEGYSWIARKTIQSQVLQAGDSITVEELQAKAQQNRSLMTGQPEVPLDGMILWPPDTTKPLDQQHRVAIVELPTVEVNFPKTMLCWAPTKVAVSADPNAAQVDTLIISCTRLPASASSIDPAAILVRQNETFIKSKNELPAGQQGQTVTYMPKDRDNHLLTTSMLPNVKKERMTVIAVWHQNDNPPNWRLFVQIQRLPSYYWDGKGAPQLPVDPTWYRPEPNKLVGAVQIYPLGYTSPYTGQKVTSVDQALRMIPAQSEAHLLQDTWSWSLSAPHDSMVWKTTNSSASRFPRFNTVPLAIAMSQYAKTGDLSIKDAVDSEGVDLVAKYNLNEKAKKDGKDGKGGRDGKDGNSSNS